MIDPTKSNARGADLSSLLLNSALAILVLIVLTVTLVQANLITSSPATISLHVIIFLLIALFNLAIRITQATNLGYEYYYENSLAFAFLSFIISARFYGFLPLLYLGGSRISVDKLGRTGYGDIGPNVDDLSRIASLPLTCNLLVSLASIPFTLQGNWFISMTAMLFAAYTAFSAIPWPRSNGFHIFITDTKKTLFYLVSGVALTVFHAAL